MPLFSPHHNSKQYLALILATSTMAINFCAWSIISPLATFYAKEFHLSSGAIALVLAAPVIVGSLGRIVAGLITDQLGGRIAFAFLCWLTIIPIILLLIISSFWQLVLVATLLGMAGTSFAVGVPYISAWFPGERRGLALGIFGMGNAGTAIAGLLAPQLVVRISTSGLFIIISCMLALMGFLVWKFAQNAPGWKPAPKGTGLARLRLAATNLKTWDMALVYAITFGAFVSFALYLPVMLGVWYELSVVDAAARAAGFVILATLARPVGGWLSDKFSGQIIIRIVLLAIIILALGMAFQQTLTVLTTVLFLSMAVVLGCGSGAVIAVTSRVIPAEILGGANGIVGAIGGLGGFLPPLVLGLTYQVTNSYTFALLLLACTSSLVLIYTAIRFKRYPLSQT